MGAGASCGASSSNRRREQDLLKSDGSFEGTALLVMPMGWQKVTEAAKFHLVFNLLLSPKVRENCIRVIMGHCDFELIAYANHHLAEGGQMQKYTLRSTHKNAGHMEIHHSYLKIEADANEPRCARRVQQWTSVDRTAGVNKYTPQDLKGGCWWYQEQEVRLRSDDEGNIRATFVWRAPERGDRYPGGLKEFQRLLPRFRAGQHDVMGAVEKMFRVWAVSRNDCPPKIHRESGWGTLKLANAAVGAAEMKPKVPDASTPVQSFASLPITSQVKQMRAENISD